MTKYDFLTKVEQHIDDSIVYFKNKPHPTYQKILKKYTNKLHKDRVLRAYSKIYDKYVEIYGNECCERYLEEELTGLKRELHGEL